MDGNRIRELRTKRGWNQRMLAERAHTPQAWISALELGKVKPWGAVVKRLSKALRVKAEELFPDRMEAIDERAESRTIDIDCR
ncbi:MAG: helix-turn-helix transcriptional regulator [Chloroflexi bacterium]|nr:helix-turn-helix transcriptional regulator [Chloroflexota bacterium]